MQPWGSFARAACCTTFALVLASACGGRSVERDETDTGNAGSSSGTGSSSSSRAGTSNTGSKPGRAGSSSTGSTTGTAGSSSGGTGSSTGSATGSSGSTSTGTGTGGSVATVCAGSAVTPRPDGSSCAAAIPRWTHDITTGICRPFIYGGCDGTANNYETLEACQKACPGRGRNYDACEAATDCVLSTTSCCDVCGGSQVTTHDFVAYNRRYEAEVSPCAGADIACDPCVSPNQAARKYFVPNCVRGECVVEDIRKSDVTACKTSRDCRLRNGSACCESCFSGDDLVAVRSDGSLEGQVCGDLPQACPKCVPMQPTDAAPSCDESGHCSVVHLLK